MREKIAELFQSEADLIWGCTDIGYSDLAEQYCSGLA